MIWEGMLDRKKPTPPTPPRPEPVATADLVAQARAEARTVGSAFCDTLTERLLTALADALEAERERLNLAQSGWAHYRDGQKAKGTRLLDAALRENP